MGLHPIEQKDALSKRCEVCGENACFTDDSKSGFKDAKGDWHSVGTNKGLVYATCDRCKKVVCGPERFRPQFARIRVPRIDLLGHYKNSKCCMQEASYINNMGREVLITCCRDETCMKHFEDDLTQRRRKANEYGK